MRYLLIKFIILVTVLCSSVGCTMKKDVVQMDKQPPCWIDNFYESQYSSGALNSCNKKNQMCFMLNLLAQAHQDSCLYEFFYLKPNHLIPLTNELQKFTGHNPSWFITEDSLSYNYPRQKFFQDIWAWSVKMDCCFPDEVNNLVFMLGVNVPIDEEIDSVFIIPMR